jgi:hypothetical protein
MNILQNEAEGIKLQQTIMKSRPKTVEYVKVALKKLAKGNENDK